MMDAQVRAPASTLPVGDIVADRYRIDGILGEGGMGVVYRAEHLHLRKAHALKVLLSDWTSKPEIVARFEREAVAAGNIVSPHVAAATDFGRLPDGTFFLVMEYVDGITLRSVLDDGPLQSVRALHITKGIVAGLQAAHALGIVHRDIKPENVMLVTRHGEKDFVKVLDFGVAKVHGVGARRTAPTQALTRFGDVIGTPDYMSPEQSIGQAVDARSDLYSVGVMLFEMLTGERPFAGGAVTVLRQHVLSEVPELPASIAASIDPRIGAVLRRLLAKVPEHRFASATELMETLEECSTPLVVVAPPPSPVSTRTPVSPRKRGPAIAALVAAAVLVTLAVSLLVASVASSGPATPVASEPSAASSSAAALPSASGAQATQVMDLPPPPAPSSSAASRPSTQGQSRRTGPAGIYVPPPSQWFK
jgi:serine/threonine protein kinase